MGFQLNFFKEDVSKWDDIHKYQTKEWLFRGQQSDSPLTTSLERAYERYASPLKGKVSAERHLLREFRRKYHHFAAHIPDQEDTLEWLSLMQHYGAPTRLLDFTYSIYVACYFAVEKAKDDCVVWAINGKWARDCSMGLFKRKSIQWHFINSDITEKNSKHFNKVFMISRPKTFVCPMNPFRLNERLTNQKGVFMVPGNIELSFEENLKTMDGWHNGQNIKKLILKTGLRKMALEKLSEMTISRATLFPGLVGFAESLKISLPVRWD